MKLYEYVIRRLVLMVFVLFAVSLSVFLLARGALPPETALAPYITPRLDDAAKLQLAKSLAVATASCPTWSAFLSHQPSCLVPLWDQYLVWLQNVFAGNWGYSLLPGISGGTTKTWDVFTARFAYTAELAIAGALVTILVALPMGIVSATHNNKLPDHVSRLIAIAGYSMPIFWLGFLLQLIFGLYITVPSGQYSVALLPTNGAFSTTCGACLGSPGTVRAYTGLPILDSILSGNGAYFWDTLVALILPTITLSVSTLGALTRIVRSSMMEALRQDYILLARSKGLKERVVVYRHAFRNALLPALTISGLIFAFLLGGVVVVEYIFAWPGVGSAAVTATTVFDVNFLELYILVTALIIVLANLGVDILYAVLDPRIKY
ncbi:MAG TPA: ABC transporter permease [Nitrososphaerales archaeon]|nr:ABC transporter permease [Nitrososphaerales archaeon]